MRKITKLTAVAVACAALAIAAHSQATPGHGVTSWVHPVHVQPDGTFVRAGPPFRMRYELRVQAPKHLCITDRRVVLYFNRENRRHRVDSERTANNGTVVLGGSWHDAPHRQIVLVRKKRILKPGNDYTCSQDHWRFTLRR
jgi:hypothetical protein